MCQVGVLGFEKFQIIRVAEALTVFGGVHLQSIRPVHAGERDVKVA